MKPVAAAGSLRCGKADIMSFYTYILDCADGTLYTGYTDNLEKRLAAHNAGEGAKYTRSRRPCRLAYAEEFAEKGEAMSREWHIKHRLTHKEKLELIANAGQE